MKLSVKYDFLPKKRTTMTTQVMDSFGVDFETGQHIIAQDFELPIEPAQIVCFTGESGSGKSSLMRAALRNLSGVMEIDQINLGSKPLIDALELPVQQGMQILSACGLSEAQLMLRTPAELSDGQRYRFRLALAISKKPTWIIADEFTATLDRTLAKVVAFNLRKLSDRTGVGFLIATTHKDIVEDLAPDLHIQCTLGEPPRYSRSDTIKKKRVISFAPQLWLSEATKSDWPYFARWHYRSHTLGFVKYVTLLWHKEIPIGICVFTSPALSLSMRNRFFGLSGKRTSTKAKALNHQLVTLSRVVIHPSYRGAGLASQFIRRSCESSRWSWIETLAQMGNINPFFERAGFVRVGKTIKKNQTRAGHSAIYGNHRKSGKQRIISKETHRKSQFSEPIYFVFDNRR